LEKINNMTEAEKRKSEEDILKRKIKRKQLEKEKIKKKESFQKSLLEPNIKENLIIWTDKYKNGNLYQGWFKDDLFFEIKRGFVTFSLKITNNNINKKNCNHFTSTDIIKLQEKANTILKENIQKIKKT
jgi:hypothetical protein